MTSSSAINDLCEEHASLLVHLSELETVIESADPKQVAEQLRAIREHLLHHFQFEERGGYLNDVLDRAPQMHGKVQELLEDHGRMRRHVDELIETAAALNPQHAPPAAFRSQARQLLKEVRLHEAGENRLIQQTANMDLGTSD